MARILALPVGQETALRVRVLNGAGLLAWQQSDTDAAQALQEEALALARQLGDAAAIGFSLYCLGDTARLRGDYPTARALLEDALRVGRDAGSRTVEAWSVGALG